MEYHSVPKRNDLLSHAKAWRNLKGIVLNEGNQSEKANYSMIPSTWHPGKGKVMEKVKISGLGSGKG